MLVLQVGSNDLRYDLRVGDPAPAPLAFWITDAGIGSLSRTTTSHAAWLHISPAGNSAPSQLTVSIDRVIGDFLASFARQKIPISSCLFVQVY